MAFQGAQPPSLLGPIYPITPTLHIQHAQVGYTIHAKGTVHVSLADFVYKPPGQRPLSDQWIPFTTLPTEGEYIVVSQTIKTPTGEIYDSGMVQGVRVDPLPKELPRVQIDGPLHTCLDYISLSGLIPGAWVYVQIENGPVLVAQQAMKGTSDTFLLDPAILLPGGKYLEVWQVAGKNGDKDPRSEPTRGLIEQSKFKNPLDSIGYVEPPKTCSNLLWLDNMLDGAQLYATVPDTQWLSAISHVKSYKFDGWLPRMVVVQVICKQNLQV